MAKRMLNFDPEYFDIITSDAIFAYLRNRSPKLELINPVSFPEKKFWIRLVFKETSSTILTFRFRYKLDNDGKRPLGGNEVVGSPGEESFCDFRAAVSSQIAKTYHNFYIKLENEGNSIFQISDIREIFKFDRLKSKKTVVSSPKQISEDISVEMSESIDSSFKSAEPFSDPKRSFEPAEPKKRFETLEPPRKQIKLLVEKYEPLIVEDLRKNIFNDADIRREIEEDLRRKINEEKTRDNQSDSLEQYVKTKLVNDQKLFMKIENESVALNKLKIEIAEKIKKEQEEIKENEKKMEILLKSKEEELSKFKEEVNKEKKEMREKWLESKDEMLKMFKEEINKTELSKIRKYLNITFRHSFE